MCSTLPRAWVLSASVDSRCLKVMFTCMNRLLWSIALVPTDTSAAARRFHSGGTRSATAAVALGVMPKDHLNRAPRPRSQIPPGRPAPLPGGHPGGLVPATGSLARSANRPSRASACQPTGTSTSPCASATSIARGSATSSSARRTSRPRSEEHTSELQSQFHLVCRLLLEKKKKKIKQNILYNKKNKTT